jgi:hypothetical protein
MNESEKIRRSIQAMVGKKESSNHTAWGTVKSVSGQTCTVTIDDCDNENILLGFDLSGVIVYPKVNKDVLILFSDEKKINGVVIYCEETDKIEIMGTEYGGLGLTEKIAERLKRIEDSFKNHETKFNNHLTLYSAHVHTGGTMSGSTGTTVPDTANVSSENLTPRTDQNYISNAKVSHGKG